MILLPQLGGGWGKRMKSIDALELSEPHCTINDGPSSSWRNQPQHNKVQGKPCVGKLQCCSRSLYEHLSNNSSLPAGHKSCEGSCYVVITLMDELGEL